MTIAGKKQANKITGGVRTFQKCYLEKKNVNHFFCTYLEIKGHAVRLQTLFLRGIFQMVKKGK